MSRTGTPQSAAGDFASSRRSTVADDGRFIFAQRAKGVSIQNIARQTGRSSVDIARFLNPSSEDAAPKPERWCFGACDLSVQSVVRLVCEQAEMSLREIDQATNSHKVFRVRRAIYAAIRAQCPGISFEEIGSIFRRDKKIIIEGVKRHEIENAQVSA